MSSLFLPPQTSTRYSWEWPWQQPLLINENDELKAFIFLELQNLCKAWMVNFVMFLKVNAF